MIIGLIIVIAICVITGFIAGAACNEMVKQQKLIAQLELIARLADRLTELNRQEREYVKNLEDLPAIRASLRTIALELQRRGGWTH